MTQYVSNKDIVEIAPFKDGDQDGFMKDGTPYIEVRIGKMRVKKGDLVLRSPVTGNSSVTKEELKEKFTEVGGKGKTKEVIKEVIKEVPAMSIEYTLDGLYALVLAKEAEEGIKKSAISAKVRKELSAT